MSRQHAPKGELPAGYHETYFTGAAWKQQKLIEIYWRLTRPGDLVFDVGANVGEFTRAFLSIGCRVVAVEPQPEVAEHIPGEATVIVKALGATAGREPFYASPTSPALSTMSILVRDNAPQITNGGFLPRQVEVTTLDALIDEYGVPVFAKIDVEGWEPQVLSGLSTPLAGLSFEVHSFQPSKADACIALLDELGDYAYSYAPGESFELEPWPPRELALFGDVYALRRDRAER